ncbi:hypothetical protein MSAN_01878700 [Mycena sanguinolenta]|uniref:Uncharacterized protein n=1 Tax=Mycena sanguinolenta TaxID=230812 RepID=A0A8H6XU83_9AGAR|nr:hypothetical protein MSAN_01878700 [Mycena sanguinolenta]
MYFLQFLRRLPPRSSYTAGGNDKSECVITQEEPQSVKSKSPIAQTAANVLVFSLKTLGSISNNIPVVGSLSGIISTLLDIVRQVQVRPVEIISPSVLFFESSKHRANEHSLAQLAARIERLTSIVTQIAEDEPLKGQGIVEKLRKELASMTQQLKAAKARGKIDQFFNSADNSSILQLHNRALNQMIADYTFQTVHEVAKSLRTLESSKLQQPHPDITGGTGGDGSSGDVGGKGATAGNGDSMLTGGQGGTGGDGGSGHTGSEGSEGEDPQVDMDPERAQVDNVPRLGGGIRVGRNSQGPNRRRPSAWGIQVSITFIFRFTRN